MCVPGGGEDAVTVAIWPLRPKVVVAAAGAVLVALAAALLADWLIEGMPAEVTPNRAAIVGTWTGSDGARVVFNANGTCVVSGMPKPTQDGTGKTWNGLPFNGTGTWWVDPLAGDPGDSGGVDVSVDSYIAFVSTTGDPAHPNMSVTIGDPDDGNELTLTKQN